MKIIIAAAAAATTAPALAAGDPPGVWSLGASQNCEAGPAWVFFADG